MKYMSQPSLYYSFCPNYFQDMGILCANFSISMS
ncbi:MAG: hypothetical protein K0S23_1239 [Fluviicola sp.]|jgi:hypothetical protein|nr:hypothetical protein [Fluviicola sp.]